jgi:anti-sigma-K factor RskA
MNHIEESLLDQYALGTLSSESVAELEEHLLICSLCQSRLVEADELQILFQEEAALGDATATPPGLSVLAFGTSFWRGAAAAVTVILILMITGGYHHAKLEPTFLLMQSLREPDAEAEMVSATPTLLISEVAAQASPPDYEIEIVDTLGNEVLKRGAEIRNGRIAVLVEKLTRGSYWVRVYDKGPGRELLVEYSLQAK